MSYSWGGIYDHPVESLFLSVGAFVFGVIGSGMSLRESIVFSAFSSVKACTDHSGYRIPWNPVNIFTTVDAAYHDKHHQRWGLKVVSVFCFSALLPDAICRTTSPFTFNFGIVFSGLSSQTTKLHLDTICGIARQRRWFRKRKGPKSNVHEARVQ